jgi:hypothetical protein
MFQMKDVYQDMVMFQMKGNVPQDKVMFQMKNVYQDKAMFQMKGNVSFETLLKEMCYVLLQINLHPENSTHHQNIAGHSIYPLML